MAEQWDIACICHTDLSILRVLGKKISRIICRHLVWPREDLLEIEIFFAERLSLLTGSSYAGKELIYISEDGARSSTYTINTIRMANVSSSRAQASSLGNRRNGRKLKVRNNVIDSTDFNGST